MAKRTSDKAAATALDAFNARFSKRHGALAMRRASDGVRKYDVIPTGSLALDYAMGCGGYIRGRITESWGPESTGKTTMALLGAASAQRVAEDRMVGFIDMEHSLDLDWAEKLGVDMTRLIVVQPDNAEELADVVKDLLRDRQSPSGKDGDPWFSQLIIDSVGNITPVEEFEKDAEQAVVGTTAKIITRMIKLNSVLAHRANTSLHVINQVRAIIGPKGGSTTGGGFALKHASTHKLKYARSGDQPLTKGSDEKKIQFGLPIAVKVEKNKVAPPQRIANIVLLNTPMPEYGNVVGVDMVPEAITLGVLTGVIEQGGGGYYTLPDGDRIKGRPDVSKRLRAEPAMVATIREQALLTLADVTQYDEPAPVDLGDYDEDDVQELDES